MEREDMLAKILEDYTVGEIIDALGMDNVLDEFDAYDIVSHFNSEDLLDKMWDTDIESYYLDNIANTNQKAKTQDIVDDAPMQHLLNFCSCYKDDYESHGFFTYQIRDCFNEFINDQPEKYHNFD